MIRTGALNQIKDIIPVLKIERSNTVQIDTNQNLNCVLSEKQLKQRFITLIRESFYEDPNNSGKQFIIDESNITAIRKCFEWAQTKETRRRGLIMYGSFGVGKSAIIEGLFKFYSELHYKQETYKPIYRTAVRIASYFRESDEYNISLCKTCSFLFIPEIGREPLKVYDCKPIEEVLSERYDYKRTVITSCNEIKHLPYGNYIYERLYHMCEVIPMRGESKR